MLLEHFSLLTDQSSFFMTTEQGRVLEFDSPINLITNPSSRFRDMVEKSGEVDALFEMAAKAY